MNKLIYICAVSDTHLRHWDIKIPKCDIFIHAGDSGCRDFNELEDFNKWLGTIEAKHRIFVAGNHCSIFEQLGNKDSKLFLTNAIYLENSIAQIEGIKIFGSPYSPKFRAWSFMKPDNKLTEIWDLIPKKTNLVITHCPCFGILDKNDFGQNCGSITLRDKIKEIQPSLFICGHIHENGNQRYTDYKTDYYNVSVLDERYQLVNPVTEIIYEK